MHRPNIFSYSFKLISLNNRNQVCTQRIRDARRESVKHRKGKSTMLKRSVRRTRWLHASFEIDVYRGSIWGSRGPQVRVRTNITRQRDTRITRPTCQSSSAIPWTCNHSPVTFTLLVISSGYLVGINLVFALSRNCWMDGRLSRGRPRVSVDRFEFHEYLFPAANTMYSRSRSHDLPNFHIYCRVCLGR